MRRMHIQCVCYILISIHISFSAHTQSLCLVPLNIRGVCTYIVCSISLTLSSEHMSCMHNVCALCMHNVCALFTISMHTSFLCTHPPASMNHVKIFKGWPLQDAPAMLVQLWYKSFEPGRFLPGGNEQANYVE